jgi:hypothetical protein
MPTLTELQKKYGKKEEETPKEEFPPEWMLKKEEKKPREPKVRILNLHKLTEENLIIFIKQVNKIKPYECKHRFYDNSLSEITELIYKFREKGILDKNRNGWYFLKEESGENEIRD